MIISISKRFNKLSDLKDILSRDFCRDCSYSLFGMGKEQSIMVRQSNWKGLQVSMRGNEVVIDSYYPNSFISFMMTLLALYPGWVKLEKKLARFIVGRFG